MRRIWLTLLLVAGTVVPATGAAGQPETTKPVGLGIRLLEVPSNRAGDPRAQKYIVDHVAPGTTIRRRAEIRNDTDGPTKVRLYAARAEIRGSSFVPTQGEGTGEIPRWVSVSPGVADLSRGAAREISVTIAVPSGAAAGERYGVVWAELPPVASSTGVTRVNRVGIRIYLSVGTGGEPVTDFVIESLTASRRKDGLPAVAVRVRNTGKRAIDVSGELTLKDGPGGVKAGPFPVKSGTLGVRATESVEVLLDRDLPTGPWDADVVLRSGTVEREARATIAFPRDAGSTAAPSKASGSSGGAKGGVGLVLAVLGLFALLAVLVMLWFLWRRRRRDEG